MGDDMTRITIEKLHNNGLNWVNYRDHMTWYLNTRDWLLHLTESTTPATYTAAGDINGQTPGERWASEEKHVKNIITSSVPNQVFACIKSKTSVMEVWNTIKAIHQSRSRMIIVDLGNKIRGTRLAENSNARIHFAKLQDMQEQLTSTGHDIDDDEFMSILLGSIPAPYEIIMGGMSAAAHSTGNPISPEHVIQMACDEYDWLVIKSGKNNLEEAFRASTQKCNKKNVECFNCHKFGHFKYECWAKGVTKKGQCPPRRTDNNQNSDNQSNRGRGNSNNRNQNNNRNNNCNDNCNNNANTAANTTDIEAWAAIEEIDEDTPEDSIYDNAYSIGQTVNQPKVKTELYNSGASM